MYNRQSMDKERNNAGDASNSAGQTEFDNTQPIRPVITLKDLLNRYAGYKNSYKQSWQQQRNEISGQVLALNHFLPEMSILIFEDATMPDGTKTAVAHLTDHGLDWIINTQYGDYLKLIREINEVANNHTTLTKDKWKNLQAIAGSTLDAFQNH